MQLRNLLAASLQGDAGPLSYLTSAAEDMKEDRCRRLAAAFREHVVKPSKRGSEMDPFVPNVSMSAKGTFQPPKEIR